LTGLTSPVLSFWHTQYNWGGDQDELRVYYKTSSGGSWTLIPGQEYTSAITSWTEETGIALPSPSADYYIAFEGLSSWGYGVCVDDVTVQEAPSCPQPTALTETNITMSSADLGWTEMGTATTWNIEWGTTGFAQGSGTIITGTTTNPHTLGVLSASTTYDWYVQADCGGGQTSSWVGPLPCAKPVVPHSIFGTFTTVCGTTSVPYFEDFDGVTPPDFPPCMTVENTNSDAFDWHTSADGLSAPNAARIEYNFDGTTAMNDWFFTQGLDLTGGVTYEVAFAYAAASATWPEKLAVDWGNAASSASMSGTPIFDDSNVDNTSWFVGNGTFTPATTGVYYVGFHGYSDAGMWNLYVDDVQVVEVVATATWTGGTDNDWNTSGNWSPGVPSSGTDVTVPGGLTNYPTLSNATSIGSILIGSGPGGDASILNDGLLVTGSATVQRYITGGVWHDLSASTQGQTVNALYQGGSPDVWLRRYNEPTNTRTYITPLTDPLDPGAGFEVWVDGAGPRANITVDYTGALQRADLTLTTASTPALSYTVGTPQTDYGYNLIGNPFASPLDRDLGTWAEADLDGTVWVWDHTAGSYQDWTSGAGSLTNGIIPMGQGFFVQATGASPSITIPMDARVHSGQAYYKSGERGPGIEQMSFKVSFGQMIAQGQQPGSQV